MKSRTSWTELHLKNTGRVPLVITGDDHSTSLKATPEFQPVNWNHTYPLTLQPGGNIALQVDYVPMKKGITTARITFSSDATTFDSVCVLNGTGIDSITIGVEEDQVPSSHSRFTLNVSPNPINKVGGVVEYTMQENGFAELTLISSTGERVATLVKSEFDAGKYQVHIPIETLSSGSYIVRMVVGNYSIERAVVIVK
ncbi:MAG: T9SS type A sorting domain-containing protein [Ignavibacteria bacterium]|nr:T9SS type A sorting domain-containing protein [Ignavibacteria bacterium]